MSLTLPLCWALQATAQKISTVFPNLQCRYGCLDESSDADRTADNDDNIDDNSNIFHNNCINDNDSDYINNILSYLLFPSFYVLYTDIVDEIQKSVHFKQRLLTKCANSMICICVCCGQSQPA